MRLPLSGIEIAVAALDGAAETMIAELVPDRPIAGGIALLEALARGDGFDAAALPITDFETALVAVQRQHMGDAVASLVDCPRCGERSELEFSLATLSDDVTPRRLPGVVAADGGYAIEHTHFRLPTAVDARAAEGHADAPDRLLSACMEGHPAPALRRRIERALTRLAPLVSRLVAVPCAACAGVVRAAIHVPSLVVGAFVREAQGVFDDVHVLARGYGWREPDILALPRARRRLYAARLREGD